MVVRFCFRSANSVCLPYARLGPWEHNPSTGLLLKFSDNVLLLLLICGIKLDELVGGASVNLTDCSFQRGNILWMRAMYKDELRRAGDGEPTIDRIDVAAFDSQEKLRDWVRQTAPGFVGKAIVVL